MKSLSSELIKEISDGRLDNSFLDIMSYCWRGISCHERFVLVLLHPRYKIRIQQVFVPGFVFFMFVLYTKTKLKSDSDINIFMSYV